MDPSLIETVVLVKSGKEIAVKLLGAAADVRQGMARRRRAEAEEVNLSSTRNRR